MITGSLRWYGTRPADLQPQLSAAASFNAMKSASGRTAASADWAHTTA